METYTFGAGFQILLLLAFLVPAILFLLFQQNTLKAIRVENRLMLPGLVWLQLIPLFGQAWQFFVVSRISDSLRKEFDAPINDSILGISEPALAGISKRPTIVIGITYCILTTTGVGMQFLKLTEGQLLIAGLFNLAGMVCWIIYWVQLGDCKRKLSVIAKSAKAGA